MTEVLEKDITIQQLERVPFGTPAPAVMEIMERDGGVIIEDVLKTGQLEELNADIDVRMEALSAGLRDATTHDEMFYGSLTKRLANVPATSRVFREEIMAHPTILEYHDAILGPAADYYWLTTAQIMELLPGQKEQVLHRDFENFPFFATLGRNAPEIATNFLIALSESTEIMGATRVIPGSQNWEDFSYRGDPSETVAAELRPGSGLLISGRVIHGGGANRSTKNRRLMALGYNVGWLTPEEAHPLMVPLEIVRTLPPRAQQLLGFRSFTNRGHHGGTLWQADMGELGDYLGL